jgi:hypothetical protein
MFLKRRFSKAASRKGKTAYKFKFTFELANLTGIPANVHHAALTFVRGAKTQTSAVAPVEECAAVWHDARSSRLEFVATLYKDASGAFQTKQYALKAQGVTGAVDGAAANHTQRRKTFAKSVLDLASFAALDGTGLDADAELQYVPLESCTKGMPGTVAGMSVQCAWLRDAEPGEAPTVDSNLPGSIRAGGGSEATELVFVGEPAAGFSSCSAEQDLEGFKDVDDDADVTDEFPGAFPELPSDGELKCASLDGSSGASLASRLAPVREGTPGRELAASESSPPHVRVVGENGADGIENAADTTQEVGAFAHEAERDVSSDVNDRVHSPYESQSEDRATPARVLVRRATAALRDEADALRLKLAEAVTRAAVAESDATEHAAHARAAREELRAVSSVEEKARAFEAESAALKKALAASEARCAAKDAALAAAEARAAEEALALSREAAEAALATERATKESAAHRRRAEKAEAEARKLAAKAERALEASSADGEEADSRRALEAARVRLSAAAAETAAATRAKDELRAECVTLRHALKQSELALKTADASKREAVAAAIEQTRKSRPPLRDANGAETFLSAKQTSAMKKLVEKLRADSRLSEASAAKAVKALAFETSARKDAEARAEDAAARARAAEAEATKKATVPTPNQRTCSLLGW